MSNIVMANETKRAQDFLEQSTEPDSGDGGIRETAEDRSGSQVDRDLRKNNEENHKDGGSGLEANNNPETGSDDYGSPVAEIQCGIQEEIINEEKSRNGERSKCDTNGKFTITHDHSTTGDENLAIEADVSSVTLLRGTVCELERALRDSRVLLKTRDEEIGDLRKIVENNREQIHKEQMKWQRKTAVAEERAREIQQLKKKLHDSEKANEELQERSKEFESPCSESELACCSSMKELIDLKVELAKRDETLAEIRKNNVDDVEGKCLVAREKSTGRAQGHLETCDHHNELKLKFLRDAFFYFMIDFHSEEQIKAILAVLAYGDQRETVILHAFRMRQRGKKFAVKEVSSRGLSFVHEETQR